MDCELAKSTERKKPTLQIGHIETPAPKRRGETTALKWPRRTGCSKVAK